jgi:hypothetical protein
LVGTDTCENLGYPNLVRTSRQLPTGVREAAILPSFIKSYDFYPLPTLWRKAASAIGAAALIVVCGYSFPAADSSAQTLLLASLKPRQPVWLHWFSDRDLAAIERVRQHLAPTGAIVFDRKTSIEALAAESRPWRRAGVRKRSYRT